MVIPFTYTVPTNSTLSTVASGLAALINAATNATQVKALVHGDRIELQSIATNLMTVPFYAVSTTPTNTPGLSYGVNYLPDSFPPQMTPGGLDKNGAFTMEVGIPSTLPYVILASTNLMNWQPIFTNSAAPGLLDFTDYDSTNYPARFYRMTWPVPDQPPQLSAPGIAGSGCSRCTWTARPVCRGPSRHRATSLIGRPCSPINPAGRWTSLIPVSRIHPADFTGHGWCLRVRPVSRCSNMATNLTLVRVDSAVRPYTVGVSTNQGQWTTAGNQFRPWPDPNGRRQHDGKWQRALNFSKCEPAHAPGLAGVGCAGIL